MQNEDNHSEEIVMKDRETRGFYTYDIDSDGMYDLADASSSDQITTSSDIDNDTEGWLENVAVVSRGGTMLTVSGKLTDIEYGDAVVMDDDADAHDSIFNREINTVSRLGQAIDAIEETDTHNAGSVVIDAYMVDGELTFVYVTSMTAGTAK